MELVDGEHIHEWARGKPLDDRLDAVQRLADALTALHAQGLDHGDVHAENVMVERNRVVLIDPVTAWDSSAAALAILASRYRHLVKPSSCIGIWSVGRSSQSVQESTNFLQP